MRNIVNYFVVKVFERKNNYLIIDILIWRIKRGVCVLQLKKELKR